MVKYFNFAALVPRLRARSAEECIRTELKRADIVVEITVVSIMPDLFAWYEAQGYEMGIVIPFTMDNYVREECDVGLQLMTKTLP